MQHSYLAPHHHNRGGEYKDTGEVYFGELRMSILLPKLGSREWGSSGVVQSILIWGVEEVDIHNSLTPQLSGSVRFLQEMLAKYSPSMLHFFCLVSYQLLLIRFANIFYQSIHVDVYHACFQ